MSCFKKLSKYLPRKTPNKLIKKARTPATTIHKLDISKKLPPIKYFDTIFMRDPSLKKAL